MTIEEWAKDFKSFVNELQMPRDDYKGIMEYIDDAISLLKEQEEKPLRCDKCSYHREDGWCGMHGRLVKETDYCSLGAWEGR